MGDMTLSDSGGFNCWDANLGHSFNNWNDNSYDWNFNSWDSSWNNSTSNDVILNSHESSNENTTEKEEAIPQTEFVSDLLGKVLSKVIEVS